MKGTNYYADLYNDNKNLWKRHNLLKVENLKDCYVKQVLISSGFDKSEISTEMIETKRLQIKLKRTIKSIENGKQPNATVTGNRIA